MRNILRAYLFNLLLGMCDPDANLNANDQAVVTWFKEVVRTYETRSANAAFNDFSLWLNKPCAWKPDPDIAKLFKLKYVPCTGVVAFNTAPNEQYYRMVGRKLTYDTDLSLLPKLPSVTFPGKTKQSGTHSATAIFDSVQQKPMVAIGGLVGVAAFAAFSTLAILVCRPLKEFFLPFRDRKPARNPSSKTTEQPKNPKPVEDEMGKKADDLTQEGPKPQPQTNGDQQFPPETDGEGPANDAEEIGKYVKANAEAQGLADDDEEIPLLVEIVDDEVATDLIVDGSTAPETAGISVIVGLIVLAVTVAVTVGTFAATSKGRLAKELQDDVQYWLVPNPVVDIQSMLADDGARARLQEIWAILTYPDIHSTLPLPTPSSSAPGLIDTPFGVQQGLGVPATFSYRTWDGIVYQPKAYGTSYFVQTGTQDLGAKGTFAADSITTTIDYTGWDGNRYMATRSGVNFIVTKHNPTDTDTFCPQSAPGGVSTVTDPSTCYSYATPSIQILDTAGNKHNLSMGALPSLNGDPNPVFYTTDVNKKSIAITAGGSPAADISLAGGTFPGGLSVSAVGGTANGVFFLSCCDAGVSPSGGTGQFTLKATNIYGSLTRDYTVTIVGPGSGPVGIVETSAPPAGSKLGTFVRWSYKATGTGPFHFYTKMNWGTMKLIDHGDGSADFEGYPYDTGGQPFFCPSDANGGCNIWVTNSTEGFTVDSNHAQSRSNIFNLLSHGPDAVFAGPSSGTFISGLGRKVTVTATGGSGVLPVQWLFPCTMPTYLNAKDNGDGSASIWTTAPGNFSGQFQLRLFPYSPGGSIPNGTTCFSKNFTANIVANTVLLSGNAVLFRVGQSGSFTLQNNNPASSWVIDSDLPNGLTLSPTVNGTATIQGTPVAGSGGLYRIRYHAVAGGVTVLTPQPLPMTINEPPAFTLPPTIHFMAGVRNSYTVVPTAGFDNMVGASYTINGHIPGSLGPNIDTPLGMDFSAITPILPTGNGMPSFEGTPDPSTVGSTRAVTVTLTNSYGSATASTVLKVVAAGDVNHDGAVDCNDYTFVKNANGQNASMPGYVAEADINQDGYVNALDLAFVTAHLPKGTVCH
jgi:hypothetical protein